MTELATGEKGAKSRPGQGACAQRLPHWDKEQGVVDH